MVDKVVEQDGKQVDLLYKEEEADRHGNNDLDEKSLLDGYSREEALQMRIQNEYSFSPSAFEGEIGMMNILRNSSNRANTESRPSWSEDVLSSDSPMSGYGSVASQSHFLSERQIKELVREECPIDQEELVALALEQRGIPVEGAHINSSQATIRALESNTNTVQKQSEQLTIKAHLSKLNVEGEMISRDINAALAQEDSKKQIAQIFRTLNGQNAAEIKLGATLYTDRITAENPAEQARLTALVAEHGDRASASVEYLREKLSEIGDANGSLPIELGTLVDGFDSRETEISNCLIRDLSGIKSNRRLMQLGLPVGAQGFGMTQVGAGLGALGGYFGNGKSGKIMSMGMGAGLGATSGAASVDQTVDYWASEAFDFMGTGSIEDIHLLMTGLSSEQMKQLDGINNGIRYRDRAPEEVILSADQNFDSFMAEVELDAPATRLVPERPEEMTEEWIDEVSNQIIKLSHPSLDDTSGMFKAETQEQKELRQSQLVEVLSVSFGIINKEEKYGDKLAADEIVDRVNATLSKPPYVEQDPEALASAATEEERRNVPYVAKDSVSADFTAVIADTFEISKYEAKREVESLKGGFDPEQRAGALFSTLIGIDGFSSGVSEGLTAEDKIEIKQTYHNYLSGLSDAQREAVVTEFNRQLGSEAGVKKLIDDMPAQIHQYFAQQYRHGDLSRRADVALTEYARFGSQEVARRHYNIPESELKMVGDPLREAAVAVATNQSPNEYLTRLRSLSDSQFVAELSLYRMSYDLDMSEFKSKFGERTTDAVSRAYALKVNPWNSAAQAVSAYNEAETAEEGIAAARKTLRDKGINPGTAAHQLLKEVGLSVYGEPVRPFYE